MSAWNILLIDSRISDIETILQSLNAETVGLVFQYDSDTYGSITATIKSKLLQLQDAVSTLTIEPAYETTPQTQTPQSTVSARVQAVGILQHNYKTPVYQFVASEPESTLEDVVAADPQLETWTPFSDFVAGLVSQYGVTALDLMACALYSDANWKYVIDTLSTRLGITIRASLDNTGAVESGGNWVLETSGVNLTTVYFTEEIYKWKYVLAIFPDYFVVRKGPSGWRALIPYYPSADITTEIQTWGPDAQFHEYLGGINQIAEQFSYFAGYWLNRNKIQDSTTYSVRVYFETDVAKDQGRFDFYATSNNPVNTYSGRFTGYNNTIYVLSPQQDGIDAGRASSSYTSIPSGPRTLLNYISSFGITGSSSNNDSTSWRSGYDTLTLTHINTYDNYFSRNTRVKIIQGDGSVDYPDWVIFNFDVDNGTGDFHGGHTTYSYFGGESSGSSNSTGGSGGLTITHGFIWGWANDKWNKLFQMELPGNGGLFNNSFAGWWASGNTVTSGNGKYGAYDTLSISHIGFSVQYTSSTLATLAPLALKVTATLTASTPVFYRKFVSGASISFDVISSNAGSVSRTHESNDTAIVTIPTAATPSASIAGPGKTTIKVTQPATGNYTQVINNELITIIVVGQGKTYTSETFPASFDLAGTNLTGSVFNSCNLTGADLYNTTVNASTSFSTSTLNSLKSGRITGVTSLLPAGYIMI